MLEGAPQLQAAREACCSLYKARCALFATPLSLLPAVTALTSSTLDPSLCWKMWLASGVDNINALSEQTGWFEEVRAHSRDAPALLHALRQCTSSPGLSPSADCTTTTAPA